MDDAEIRHLAKLARIRIEENEIPKIAENLRRVLGYVSEIQNVVVEDGRESAPDDPKNVMREDTAPHAAGEYSEDILKNVPEREGDYVKVRKIL